MSESFPAFIVESPAIQESDPNPRRRGGGNDINRLEVTDKPVHGWYRFVLSYPPHLVRSYLKAFGANKETVVLDPFCGTGTTIVESKINGIPSVGVESVPMAQFAASVKTDWTINPNQLREHAESIAEAVENELMASGIVDEGMNRACHSENLLTLCEEKKKLLLKDSISPLPLHKSLVLLNNIRYRAESRNINYEMLALASALVQTIGNLKFGPEVGIGSIKKDTPVIQPWLHRVNQMSKDIYQLRRHSSTPCEVIWGDAREISTLLPDESIDIVITSPPYPNEKDYTRTTRLESVLLDFINSKDDLRQSKKLLVRSNTRGVYKEDIDDVWIADHPKIQGIADRIERRRIELGKTSGFERMYHRVTKLYFGGMAKHLNELKKVLRPGAKLAYVVGDQASYLRVMINTGQLLAEIAENLGYEVLGIDLFRTRAATATRSQLREEVVVLQWPKRRNRR